MKPYILILFVLLTVATTAQNRSINFRHDAWQQILADAKAQNKLVFVDAYTTWCGPCKWMAANIFTQDTVADFFNRNFICAKFDMESAEGSPLSAAYNVKVYPTLLFIDGDGNEAHRAVGALDAMPLINAGLTALNPKERISFYQQEYKNGNRAPFFIYSYIKKLDASYKPYKDELEEFFNGKTDKDLLSLYSWKIIYECITDVNDPRIKFLAKNRLEFAKKYTKDSVEQKLYDVYNNQFNELFRIGLFTGLAYNELIDMTRAAGFDRADEVITMAEMIHFDALQDKDNFMKMATKMVDQYNFTQPEQLNYIAWRCYEMNDDNIAALQQGEQWAQMAANSQQKATNYETLAALQLKQGKSDKAKKNIEKALDLARSVGEDTTPYEELLKQIDE